jgi:PAS domain S-box-containing protein
MSTDQNSHRQRRLFELVRDPLFVIGADGRSHAANAAGLAMLALTEEEFLARPWWEVIHRDDRAATEIELADVLDRGGTGEPFRLRVGRPGGDVRWVEAQSTFDAETGLIYVIAHDMTDREDAFMDRLAGAFRDAPLGMALVAPDGRFLRVNWTLYRLLGHTAEELLARRLPDVVEDEGLEATLAAGAPALQIETRMRHADGRAVVALVSLTLVRDLREDPEYYVC